MGKLLYHLFIVLYPFVAKLLGLFNPKAKKWVTGRQGIFNRLQQALSDNQRPVLWMHCASLGEFEQGRPLLEAVRQQQPETALLLTFFSPSGYEVCKYYEGADWIFYLPIDGPLHARRFYNIVKPSLVLFVKYEYWFYYLREAKRRSTPLFLVSGIFRNNQPFFNWYGSFHRTMLNCFRHFFVQNQESVALLHSIAQSNVTLTGDTRFDRVIQIAQRFTDIDGIADFCNNKPVIVAGSTWTEDDKELDHYANTHPELRFVVAPHDIGPERIKECLTLYKHAILYSDWVKGTRPADANVLIIDNIGMLSRLYHYATICYVGGGFGGDGIHNILEAAVYYKPVVFGPVFDKYFEAVEMVEENRALSVANALHLEQTFNNLLQQPELYADTCSLAGDYVHSRAGATAKILSYLQEKRLFTS